MFSRKILILATLILLFAPSYSHAATKKAVLGDERVENITDNGNTSLGSLRIRPPETWFFDPDSRGAFMVSPDEKAAVEISVRKENYAGIQSEDILLNFDTFVIGGILDGGKIVDKGRFIFNNVPAVYITVTQNTASAKIIAFASNDIQYGIVAQALNKESWILYKDIIEKSLQTLKVSNKIAKIPPLKITRKLAPQYVPDQNVVGMKLAIKPPLGWKPKELTNEYGRHSSLSFSFGTEKDNGAFAVELIGDDERYIREFTLLPSKKTFAGVPAYIEEQYDEARGVQEKTIHFVKNRSRYLITMRGTPQNWKKYKSVMERSIQTLKIVE